MKLMGRSDRAGKNLEADRHIIGKLMDLKEKLDLSVRFHINSAVDATVSV